MKTGYQPSCPVGRFLLKVIVLDSGCWEWVAYRNPGGYGVFSALGRNGSPALAHRWWFERSRGAIPQGADLDHLCRNRACVNPNHLEPVSRSTNARRGAGLGGVLRDPALPLPRPKKKTHCKHGHPLSGSNAYFNGRQRVCRECDRIRSAKRAEGRREYMRRYYLEHKGATR